MTALTSSYTGSVETVERDLRPIAAGQTTYAGHVCVANPGGVKPGFYGEATGALGEIPVGRFYGQYGAVTNAGADGSVSADVQFFRERTLMLVNNDTGPGALTAAQRETTVSIADAITATVDTGIGLADLGIFYDFSEDGSGQVWIEMPYPSSAQDQGPAPTPPAAGAFIVRAVANQNLPAYNGSGTGVITAAANGALAAQDGVALAVNDLFALRLDCTNLTALSDVGPYILTAAGSAGSKWSAKRPPWFFTGGVMPSGKSIEVAEGTVFAGTSWKVFAVKGKVIDTDDPVLFPKSVTVQVQLLAGGGNIAITSVPLRSATKSNAIPAYAGGGAPNAATLGYQPGAITPAALGAAASVTIQAVKAQMVAQAADTSILNVTLVN